MALEISEKINSTLLVTIAISYFGTCAGLWHIGFWSSYDINYLQYIGLTDIIKNFISPFVTSLGTVFLVIFLNSFIGRRAYGKGRNTDLGVVLNKGIPVFLIIYIICSVLFVIAVGNKAWPFLPYFIAIPISLYIDRTAFLSKLINEPSVRFYVVFFLILLPLFSFCYAKDQSIRIRDNISYKRIIDLQFSNNQTSTQIIGQKLIGTSSDKIFLSNMDNSEITILNMEDVRFIKYKSIN